MALKNVVWTNDYPTFLTFDLYPIPTFKVGSKSDMQYVKGPNLEWTTVAWTNVVGVDSEVF